MRGTIPSTASMPSVHREVEKNATWFREVGDCGGNRILLSEHPRYSPGTSNLGTRVSRQQDSWGVTVKCAQSVGRKQKCLIFLLHVLQHLHRLIQSGRLLFMAARPTGHPVSWAMASAVCTLGMGALLGTVSCTNHVALTSWWLLRDCITEVLMEQLDLLSCFPGLEWEGRHVCMFCCLWGVNILCQRSVPQANAPKYRGSICARLELP